MLRHLLSVWLPTKNRHELQNPHTCFTNTCACMYVLSRHSIKSSAQDTTPSSQSGALFRNRCQGKMARMPSLTAGELCCWFFFMGFMQCHVTMVIKATDYYFLLRTPLGPSPRWMYLRELSKCNLGSCVRTILLPLSILECMTSTAPITATCGKAEATNNTILATWMI